MDNRERGSKVSTATCYAAGAAAAFSVAAVELARLAAPGASSPLALWMACEVIGGVGAVYAILLLRRRIGDAVGPGGLLRWLCVVLALLAVMRLLGVLDRVGSPRLLIDVVRIKTDLLSLVAAVLFAATAYRVWHARAKGLLIVAAFAALAAVGYLQGFLAALLPMAGLVAVRALAYVLLGVYFARGAPVPHPAGIAGTPRDSPPRTGRVAFAVIVVGSAAIPTAMLCFAQATGPRAAGPLATVAAWLLAPQWTLLDNMGLGDYPILLFPLAVVTFPIVLLPLGIHLIAPGALRKRMTVVLQVIFLLAYLVLGFMVMISGIRG